MEKLNLKLIFRNFEMRAIEGLPIKDPLAGIHQAKCDMPLDTFIEALQGEAFKDDVARAKMEHGLTKAYICEKTWETMKKEQQERLDDAIFLAGLYLELYQGPAFFGGGGLNLYTLILL